MSIRALLIVAGFAFAAPALAQAPAPVAPASVAFTPPPAVGLQPGGMQREPWLAECERRLNTMPGAAPSQSTSACVDWWAYYQGGGAPHPTYGYAIPISVTEDVKADCPEQVIEKRVIHRRVIRHKILRDKRIPV